MKYSFLSLFLVPHLALACGGGGPMSFSEILIRAVLIGGYLMIQAFLLSRKEWLLFILLLLPAIAVGLLVPAC
jgi:hypothetical protein